MNNLPTLQGQICILQPFELRHVTDRYISWLNDIEVTRFTEARNARHDRQSSEAYIAANQIDANVALWRIVFKDQHIGNIRLSAISQSHGRANIAILIGEQSVQGKGIGTDAIKTVSAYAIGELNLRKICAGIYGNNKSSLAAFKKSGFVNEATLSRHAILDGVEVDVELLACFAN